MLIIAAIITGLFIVISLLMFGWVQSISKIYYKLKEKGKGWKWLFTFFMWFVGITIMYLGGKDTNRLAANTFYIGGAFLMYVGVFPNFEDKDEKWRHYLCAFLGLVITLIAFVFRDNNYWSIILFAISSGLLKVLKVNNIFFWIEITFIVLTFMALS